MLILGRLGSLLCSYYGSNYAVSLTMFENIKYDCAEQQNLMINSKAWQQCCIVDFCEVRR